MKDLRLKFLIVLTVGLASIFNVNGQSKSELTEELKVKN